MKTGVYHLVTLLMGVLIAASAASGQSSSIDTGKVTQAQYTVAFASFGPLHAQLFISDGDGSNAKPLMANTSQDYNASFSHDSRWIVFTSDRDGSADIYRVHPDGTGLERLVDDPAFDDQAALSPDGKLLAFVSSRSGQADIWILEMKTRKLRNLTSSPGGDFRPAWSPDGKWIAFSSDRVSQKPKDTSGFGTTHSTELFLIRPDGSGLQRITHADAFVGSPAWSSDGKQLVFYTAETAEVIKIVAPRRFRGTTQIVAFDLNTKEQHVLTSGPNEKLSPQWSATKGIVYTTRGPDGGIETVTGQAETRGKFESPKWSADGRHMVFHRDVDDSWPPMQNWWSRDSRFQLVRTGVFPNYSPRGDLMLCNDQTAGILHNSILMMHPDGTNRSVLFTNKEKSALGAVFFS